MPVRFRVVPQEEGLMLGRLVARRLPDFSAADGNALVKAGGVYMGHLRVRVPATRVATGERITAYPETLGDAELDPDSLRFVHREEAFVVIDKVAGVPVSATRSSARGTLAEALRRTLRQEGMERPYVGVVHRLDRGASGLLLITTRSVANKSLHRQFAEHSIARTYRVLVRGEAPAAFECTAALVEQPDSEGMKVAKEGQPRAKSAHTKFRRVTPKHDRTGCSLLEVELLTGRTHQIRLHAAELGFAVVGDRRYGSAQERPSESPSDSATWERLHLHAWRLAFEHPESSAAMVLHSPLPEWALAEHDPET